MRRGRFSGLIEDSGEAAPLSLAHLLSFDLCAARDEEMAGVAAERARSLAVAVPLLAACHLLWASVLVHGLWSAGLSPPRATASWLAAAVLLADLGLWRSLRGAMAPRGLVRLLAAHSLVTGALWVAAAAAIASGPAASSLAIRGSLIVGVGSSLPLFFLVPALAASSCAAIWATSAAAGVDRDLLGVGGAMAIVLVVLSLFRARDQVLVVRRRLRLEAEAEKAERFVDDYEASGRGWFWETNARGALTYVSEQLAARLGTSRGELLGRPLQDVLFAEGADETLSFHFASRFPFAEATVRAPGAGAGDVRWSLSGSPNFDSFGRFLGFRGLGANLSEQQRGEAETKKLARYDSLTGLPNRATMRGMLDEALANAAERRQGCGLFMIDLDRFKQVNDTLGHPVGDKLLRKVAERLTGVLGRHGVVGRLGGDEFEAILPGCDGEGDLGELAGALIAEVSRPYQVDGHRIEIGTSVGIAVGRPGRAYAAELVRDADLALYAAKAAGRGAFRLFDPGLRAEAADRQLLENDLREALGRDQLRLLYQPIVDSVTEDIVAFEALLRWHHPTRGIVMPADLIPIAEEAGLMPRIGDWVLRTACREAGRWPAHIRIAVDLSPAQLADPALPATLAGTLAHVGLDPERLELEVGEAVFLDGPRTAERLERLKRIGVRLALDNFGTGQSGLGQLRTAPLDKIKIDRSFVQGAAAAGSRNAAIVRAIVVLAESLGMDTTAEGAESPEAVALIRRLGCSQVQGFQFGRPAPAEDALKLATDSRPSAEVIGFSRPPRHRLIRNGRLKWDGGEAPVRLRNISEGGAMIEAEATVAPGERAVLDLDLDEDGRVEVQVRWRQRGQIGLMFARPFNLARLARARRAPADPHRPLTPRYLDPGHAPETAAAPSPLATKRRRSG
ncbi:MAG: EAL domain-containing protein [Alphaproteobacteria bacterium]|nr:EAL domain-containing protein [Alphaproteobacteria bacterium]MBV9370768.1 EAL domain-containing protein [Alphaproteobacteria bacterium]MBV9899841.1 EAL domain-containing protein [Alphaproteobacteria bacterium]